MELTEASDNRGIYRMFCGFLRQIQPDFSGVVTCEAT